MELKEITFSLSEAIVPILGAIIAWLSIILNRKSREIEIIKTQLSDKKYNSYHEIFAIVFDVIKSSKKLIDMDENRLVTRLMDVRKDLYIYAPDSIIKKFDEWQKFNSEGTGGIKHIVLYMELLVLIRKDMGHHKTTITPKDILKSVMTNNEEFDKLMLEIES